MGCSTKQVPFIIASIALITGGILFFAFPYVKPQIWLNKECMYHVQVICVCVLLCSVRNIFEKYINEGALVAVPVAATVLQGLLFLLACSTFFLSSFVDPGIYPRGGPLQCLDASNSISIWFIRCPFKCDIFTLLLL